jgi:hypothetical protein
MAATLLGVFGCASDDAHLKPPKVPDEYNVPPLDDPRFSQPPKYPAGTLNNDPLNKVKGDGEPATPGGFRPSGAGARFTGTGGY